MSGQISEIFKNEIEKRGVERLRKERIEIGNDTLFCGFYKTSLETVNKVLGKRKRRKGPQEITIPTVRYSEGDTLKGCAHRDVIGKIFPSNNCLT